MFRARPEARPPAIEVLVDGAPVRLPEGATAAAALMLAGAPARETALDGSPRAPFCQMGVCFDCLAEIDGVPNRQSCLVPAVPGMRIDRQRGARAAGP
jgi:hypothetical protein